MKTRIITLLLCTLCAMTVQAQFTRLHVKTPSGADWGITTEASSGGKIIGISHDGSAGTIATGSLSGATYTPLQFSTAGSVRMTIKENGFVGIGTNNPAAELTVAGKIWGREVRVNVAAGTGPDYVFESNYRLLPLSATEAFIRANKHLPDVPTARQMENEGVELGKMNMLLLKKIEELTLHMIEQNKQLERLAGQVAAQREEIAQLRERKSKAKK